ncbi:MAG: hypothetical protein NC319_01835 [Butyricicoccus sp.]|nr:hypothetical protein [Butyricicoccus sp.]
MRKHTTQDDYNPHLKALILQVVDNQIAGRDENGQPIASAIADDPDYVKNNFVRLSDIHGSAKAKEMIASVLLEEMYDVLKYQKVFDEFRYRTRLERLK